MRKGMLRAGLIGATMVGALALCAGNTRAATPEEQALIEQASGHWAFAPLARPKLPALGHPEPLGSPVDAFALSRLQSVGLEFSPPAGRGDLLRRVSFDLLGLPPALEDVGRFLADKSPDAYARLLESMLANPHYGEAWGRHWLDVVRFAETAGFNADPARPLAYKYRDYVVRAFNDDKPYDRFVQEQLAGDELFPNRRDALVATGYLLMWPDESNASDVLLARQDGLNDLTANVGQVFLGLSVGCAQCHDHKFDPISQRDFYSLQSFFTGIVRNDRVPIGTHLELSSYRQEVAAWSEQTAALRRELFEIEQAARAEASHEKRLKFPTVVLEALDTWPDERTTLQQQLAFFSERQIEVKEAELLKKLTAEQKTRRGQIKQDLKQLKRQHPRHSEWLDAMAAVEVSSKPPATFLLDGGSYRKPLDEVAATFPTALRDVGGNFDERPTVAAATSGRRTFLASWLTDPRNPLVARVMVNRIWLHHFGRGLVSDANDFGTQGAPPTHLQLLDWLAAEFVESGWSIKHMHRLILTSNVYRQSTYRRTIDEPSTAAAEIDPDNQLYWSYPRRRLSAEQIRDGLLTAANLLNRKMYGPGVRPPLPPKFSSREAWKVSKEPCERNRRSVYIYAKRNLRYPLLQAFDFPDMHESCAVRSETTIAPQALMLLNSQLVLDASQAFAHDLLRRHGGRFCEAVVDDAYLAALGRTPDPDEARAATAFVEQQTALSDTGTEHPTVDTVQVGLADLCHVLFNSNEFIYVE